MASADTARPDEDAATSRRAGLVLACLALALGAVGGCATTQAGTRATAAGAPGDDGPHAQEATGDEARGEAAAEVGDDIPSDFPGLPSDSDLAWLGVQLAGVRHIYVGETHANARSQGAQLAVLEALRRAGRHLVVGVEWFPSGPRPGLDGWLEGTVPEADLKQAVGWDSAWGHPLGTYLPLMRWARDHRVPLVGLNAPEGLARRFARLGPGELSDEDTAALPPLDSGNALHRRWFCERLRALVAEYGGHHGDAAGTDPAADGAGSELPPEAPPEAPPEPPPAEPPADPCADVPPRFYEAQLLRDEVMAAGVTRLLGQDPAATVVVLAGDGHVIHGLGVPRRVMAATGLPAMVVLQPDPDDVDAEAAGEGTPSDPAYGPAADLWWPRPGS